MGQQLSRHQKQSDDGVTEVFLQMKGVPSSRISVLFATSISPGDRIPFTETLNHCILTRFPSYFSKADFPGTPAANGRLPYQLTLNAGEYIDPLVLRLPFSHQKVFEIEAVSHFGSSKHAEDDESTSASDSYALFLSNRAQTKRKLVEESSRVSRPKSQSDKQEEALPIIPQVIQQAGEDFFPHAAHPISTLNSNCLGNIFSFLPMDEIVKGPAKANRLFCEASKEACAQLVQVDKVISISTLIDASVFIEFLRIIRGTSPLLLPLPLAAASSSSALADTQEVPQSANINKLEILDGLFMSEDHLRELLTFCGPNLQHLALKNCPSVRNTCIDQIPTAYCQHLETISFEGVAMSVQFFNGCHQHLTQCLRELSIHHPRFVEIALPGGHGGAGNFPGAIHLMLGGGGGIAQILQQQQQLPGGAGGAAAAAPVDPFITGFRYLTQFMSRIQYNGMNYAEEGEDVAQEVAWEFPYDVVQPSFSALTKVSASIPMPKRSTSAFLRTAGFETCMFTLLACSPVLLSFCFLKESTAAASYYSNFRPSTRMGSCVKNILGARPDLKHLTLSGLNFDENSLRTLVHNLPSLETLTLHSYSVSGKPDGLSPHFAAFRSLKTLTLTGFFGYPGAADFLPRQAMGSFEQAARRRPASNPLTLVVTEHSIDGRGANRETRRTYPNNGKDKGKFSQPQSAQTYEERRRAFEALMPFSFNMSQDEQDLAMMEAETESDSEGDYY